MAEEKQEVQETAEKSEESRREFLSKAATTAGSLGIAGLLADLFSSEADAQLRPVTGASPAGMRSIIIIEGLSLKAQRVGNARTVTLSGKNLAAALSREGMISFGEEVSEAGLSLTVK